MLYTVNCAILGNKNAFSVKIDSNEQVSELKEQIRAEEFQTLASFEASALELYKANIPVSDSDYDTLMESVSQNTVEDKEDQRLRNPFSKLSTAFGATGPLVEETLHILVKRPRGESFSPS